MQKLNNKRVVIVYNYIHHYRIPIFKLLSNNSDIHYCIYAGIKSEINIKKADIKLSTVFPSKGGLNWKITKNYWFFKRFLFQPNILCYSFFRKFDSFIYLGNMYYLSTWISAIVARIIGKKVIFWTHGFIRDENNFIGFIRSIFYKIPNEILVYGQRAKNILISKGFEESKIKLIYNSLDYDYQSKLLPEKNKINFFNNMNLPIVGFIGRLTKQKKVHQLIEVLNLLQINKKFNLLIIGDGDQYPFLNKLVENYNLSSYVFFTGAIYIEQENCNLISSMDVLVSPGEVGLTAIHSMTYGTPVITHNNFSCQMPEHEVIIPGITGEFFDYDNPINSMSELIPRFYGKRSFYSKNCKEIIRKKYNPNNQLLIFNSVA